MKNNPKNSSLEDRVDDIRAELKHVNVYQLASLTGAEYKFNKEGHGLFHLSMWEKAVFIDAQDFIAKDLKTQQPLDTLSQAFIAYYFYNAKPNVDEEGWISFSRIPNCKFYNSAHQAQTSEKLLCSFSSDYQAFEEAAKKAGGKLLPFSTIAYEFQVFPKVALLAALWKGDEDFPPSYKILFNHGAMYHLNAEAYAILSSMLTKRIIKAA